ncbi:hypothetical protein QA640_25145 [Bradyrhizobium sp. CB82]|uniref:hypothetical protein n=1 Tax=Bradyrhizobium sp. CB82 TaxID=3039159 RepID=UPI0024B1297A|nr:hypothetical protein [Bradyrhizobium sp. CB82]WFU37750.1 hypothetical protein QA640_25145 [Bradyrhizobium sp. CB82]
MKPIDHIKKFVADLRADPELAALADDVERALHATDLEADYNDHAAAFFAGVEWLVTQPRSLDEKIEAIAKLANQKGFVHIPNLREFAGW